MWTGVAADPEIGVVTCRSGAGACDQVALRQRCGSRRLKQVQELGGVDARRVRSKHRLGWRCGRPASE